MCDNLFTVCWDIPITLQDFFFYLASLVLGFFGRGEEEKGILLQNILINAPWILFSWFYSYAVSLVKALYILD